MYWNFLKYNLVKEVVYDLVSKLYTVLTGGGGGGGVEFFLSD
jgi:hypothetical protein